MKKTKYCSYCVNGISDGCKLCVKGRKLVLFISGVCDVNCYYCSLSELRKNSDKVWANERICKNVNDLILEVKESNATGCGITGGDPFLRFGRTLKYAKTLKKNFKNFHIHIYLPTRHISADKLKKLSKYVDEVRFHPEILIKKLNDNEINKIKLALKYFKKKNIGIELPLIPEKKKNILDFILKVKNYIGFVNLNELEIGDTNFKSIVNKYKMKDSGYVVSGSKEAGLWILKRGSDLKIHLCTAKLKNWFQYKNRLLLHNILPYGYKTKEGTVRYFVIDSIDDFDKLKKYKEIYLDKKKNRIIISEKVAKKLVGKYKILKVEEYPTYDGKEIIVEEI